MQDLVLDVGANRGDFGLEVAARNPDILVLAFEPIPQLRADIAAAAAARGLGNLTTIQAAADAHPRTATFHVADHEDLGVSSLLEFDSLSISNDEYWTTRKDLYFDHAIEVDVVRLDSVPAVQQAERIRFIKIDAQGVDMPALESLGDLLMRVEAGVLEVPSTHESRMYVNEAYDLQSAMNRLQELGFRTYAIKPNDHATKEVNLFFCRHDVDWRRTERELGLRGIPLYDGKHFWHSPSDRLMPDIALADQERVLARLETVEGALARECAETKRLNALVAERDRMVLQYQMMLTQLR
jgi:FkbM family methyltransferase